MKHFPFAYVSTMLGMALSCVLSQGADAPVDVSKLPPAAAIKGVTFTKDIQPILEKSCVKCHSGRRPKGHYDMTTLEGVIKGNGKEPAVVPGKSTESRMVQFAADLVVDFEMPPKDMREDFPALTKDQIGLIRAWIDQGAK